MAAFERRLDGPSTCPSSRPIRLIHIRVTLDGWDQGLPGSSEFLLLPPLFPGFTHSQHSFSYNIYSLHYISYSLPTSILYIQLYQHTTTYIITYFLSNTCNNTSASHNQYTQHPFHLSTINASIPYTHQHIT